MMGESKRRDRTADPWPGDDLFPRLAPDTRDLLVVTVTFVHWIFTVGFVAGWTVCWAVS